MEKHRRVRLRFVFGLKDGDLGGSELEASAPGAAERASGSNWHRDVKVREAMTYD